VRFYWEQSFKSSQVPRPDAWWVCCPSNASQKVPVSSKKKKMAEEIFVHPKKKLGGGVSQIFFGIFIPNLGEDDFFIFIPIWGRRSNLTHIFQLG